MCGIDSDQQEPDICMQIRKMFGKGTEHEDVYPLSRLIKSWMGRAGEIRGKERSCGIGICSSSRMRCHSCLKTGDKYSSRKLVAQWLDAIVVTTDFRPVRLRNCARPIPVWRCWRGPSRGPLMFFRQKRLPERRWIRRGTAGRSNVGCGAYLRAFWHDDQCHFVTPHRR